MCIFHVIKDNRVSPTSNSHWRYLKILTFFKNYGFYIIIREKTKHSWELVYIKWKASFKSLRIRKCQIFRKYARNLSWIVERNQPWRILRIGHMIECHELNESNWIWKSNNARFKNVYRWTAFCFSCRNELKEARCRQ